MAGMFDPIQLAMGKGLKQNSPLGSETTNNIADFMGTAEDPFQLHRSGLFQSPWTAMQQTNEQDGKDAAAKNLAGIQAWNTSFGNNY